MHNCFVYKVSYLCFGGLETSSSLRQASSSCARVLGGGRGGIAGSWMKGWPGWWPRRWAPLPMPPPPQDEEVRPGRVLESSGLDFFRPWVLLKQKKGSASWAENSVHFSKDHFMQTDTYLCGLCFPCLSLSRIHCQTFWERSVATRGRRGEDTPSSEAFTGRLDKVLQRLEEEGKLAPEDQRKSSSSRETFKGQFISKTHAGVKSE